MVLEQTANPVLTGFTAPKLLWVRDRDPAAYERVRHILLPKDYIRFRLTGEYASDVSDASGTALFDVANRRWATPLIEKLGIDAAALPAVVESPERTARSAEPRRRRPDSGREPRWSAARAIRRRARSATASSRRAWFPARSARPAWCSRIWTRPLTIPREEYTLSATPRPASGTSWALRRARA